MGLFFSPPPPFIIIIINSPQSSFSIASDFFLLEISFYFLHFLILNFEKRQLSGVD